MKPDAHAWLLARPECIIMADRRVLADWLDTDPQDLCWTYELILTRTAGWEMRQSGDPAIAAVGEFLNRLGDRGFGYENGRRPLDDIVQRPSSDEVKTALGIATAFLREFIKAPAKGSAHEGGEPDNLRFSDAPTGVRGNGWSLGADEPAAGIRSSDRASRTRHAIPGCRRPGGGAA